MHTIVCTPHHTTHSSEHEKETWRSSAPRNPRYGQHGNIQDFYYDCNFPSCKFRFGTALAWMNHELSTHLSLSARRCSEHSSRDRSSSSLKCGQLFREEALSRWHLICFYVIPKVGSYDTLYIDQQLGTDALEEPDNNASGTGFCKEIVLSPCTPLPTDDWSVLFDRINDEHFNKAKLPHDRCPIIPHNPYGYLKLEFGQ